MSQLSPASQACCKYSYFRGAFGQYMVLASLMYLRRYSLIARCICGLRRLLPVNLVESDQFQLSPNPIVATDSGYLSLLFNAKRFMADVICFWLLMLSIVRALRRTRLKAGSPIAMITEMMEMTTSSSTSVNPRLRTLPTCMCLYWTRISLSSYHAQTVLSAHL